MATQAFNIAKKLFNLACIDWRRDTFRLALIDTSLHTLSTTDTVTFQDITTNARIGNSGGHAASDMPALANKTLTTTSGYSVADADDITFTAVPVGNPIAAAVLFKDIASAGTTESVTFGAPSSDGVQVISGIASATFVSGHERGILHVTGAASGNNGYFPVLKYTSTSNVSVYNPSGSSQTVSATWAMECPVLVWYDSAGVSGLPFTPNGSDASWVWSSGSAKIWRV